MLYQIFVKPILFLFPPEKAHKITITLWHGILSVPLISGIVKWWFRDNNPSLVKKVFGLSFPNPVGLAAGFDKDGKYFEDMVHLGFGFIEIGTVTPKPQGGNPVPRLFRLPEDKALINRMGFNNDGVDAMVKRLKSRKNSGCIIGGNIGKNKDTPNENALEDYKICLHKLYDFVDYFVVNVSSPNTPGLRSLQEKVPLTEILTGLKKEIDLKSVKKPVLLKIAPDLTNEQLDDIIDIVITSHTDGIIATNTTIDRNGLKSDTEDIGAGGLSGSPVKNRSTEVIRYLSVKSKGKIPIIGVGGISDIADVKEKMEAGASLIQIYTGLIYKGPMMVKNIKKSLVK
ncbi:MAG: quinone-dependent dihydroorotate dehydrogenase [Saprospiraceae bacterium]|nr:quinone-dependent dihydroorotate dehydrogenase [Saprospiraceae bacterium]